MIGFLGGRPAVEVLVLIAAALTALTVIIKAGRGAWNVAGKAIAFFQRVEKVVVNVERQLYPNGGASLRDAVNRIQEHLGINDIAHDSHSTDNPHNGPIEANPHNEPPPEDTP